jgi:hypothetical protein
MMNKKTVIYLINKPIEKQTLIKQTKKDKIILNWIHTKENLKDPICKILNLIN